MSLLFPSSGFYRHFQFVHKENTDISENIKSYSERVKQMLQSVKKFGEIILCTKRDTAPPVRRRK